MNHKTILLVEDNSSDVLLTKRALKKGHFVGKLAVAEDGEEALEYLFGTRGYTARDIIKLPTLILLDLKMPKVDGLEVLRHIRANGMTRTLPVVILTSSKEEQDVAASYDLGANSYIQKPVNSAKFEEVIMTLRLYWLVLNEPPPVVWGKLWTSG
jgi:two-component system response regulator